MSVIEENYLTLVKTMLAGDTLLKQLTQSAFDEEWDER
jgi:hypothetical protein